jgi:pyruvate dehydrogenase complex dehydrogenase (E1) component
MKNIDNKLQKKLDSAWYRAYNSAYYDILGIDGFSKTLQDDIKWEVYKIEKSKWWPIAENLLMIKPQISKEQLANDAATIAINQYFNTDKIQIRFNGGF